jgi:hypothetical protein
MQKGGLFTKKTFGLWILSSIWHSVVIYFGCNLLFANEVLQKNGLVAGMWEMGTIASTIMVVVVNLRIGIETK